jgi:hypothetical protein
MERADGRADLRCKFGIVGGGTSGVYLAYRLTPSFGDAVCVFEREAELGGRVRDESTGDVDGPWIGTGARRLQENHHHIFALAKELHIDIEKPAEGSELIGVDHKYSYVKNDFLSRYPKLRLSSTPAEDQETYLYNLLQKGPERKRVADFPDLATYIDHVAGPQALDFLRDMSRFRVDFKRPIAARWYWEYMDEESEACCQPSYPVGGMSAFWREMAKRTLAQRGRIFTSEAITEITKRGSNYLLRTAKDRMVEVEQLVITAPPEGFNRVKGDIAARIQATEMYRALMPIEVVVINNVWPYKWWDVVRDPVKKGEQRTWRTWTTDHCVSHTEIPLEPYARAQNVTRTVYNDDPDCVSFWKQLRASKGIAGVRDEVVRGLSEVFNDNKVSVPQKVLIPTPTSTTFTYWPAAWYFFRAGVKFGSEDMRNWMLDPLPGEKNLYVAGEAYWATRPGWTDGAYRAINRLMTRKLGVKLPSDQTTSSD